MSEPNYNQQKNSPTDINGNPNPSKQHQRAPKSQHRGSSCLNIQGIVPSTSGQLNHKNIPLVVQMLMFTYSISWGNIMF